PSSYTLSLHDALPIYERLLFPGLVLPALVLLGALARVRGVAEDRVRRARRVFGLIAVIAFVLSLGPYLMIWGINTRLPMPYLLLDRKSTRLNSSHVAI